MILSFTSSSYDNMKQFAKWCIKFFDASEKQ